MKPAIATVGILVFIMTWNEFLFGMILSVEKSLPITVGITMFAGAWSIDWGAIAAAISIGIIPSIIFILFARKFLIKGLTMGCKRIIQLSIKKLLIYFSERVNSYILEKVINYYYLYCLNLSERIYILSSHYMEYSE